MRNSSNGSSAAVGKSFTPYVGAVIGAAAAVSMQTGQAAVVGYAEVNYVIPEGEEFSLPQVPGLRYRNKISTFCDIQTFSTIPTTLVDGDVVIGALVGPGGIIPSFQEVTECSKGTYYLPFSFQESDGTHFGWTRATQVGPSMVITDYAFESAGGTPIVAGDLGSRVPEPSALALAAAGLAIGFGIRRRKRAAAM